MDGWNIPEKGMILNSIKIQDFVNEMQTGVTSRKPVYINYINDYVFNYLGQQLL